jgi:hypothetical protein
MSSRVKVNVDLEHANFMAGQKVVKRGIDDLKEAAVAALGTEALVEWTKGSLDLGSSLTNSALALNMTVEQVQVLTQAAKDSGMEFDKLREQIDKVNVLKAKALGGDKASQDILKQFGVTTDMAKSTRGVDLLFGTIAQTVKEKGGEAMAGPLSEMFGKSFGEVLPLFNQNIQDITGHLQSMGGLMSTDTAVALKTMNDQFEEIGTMLKTMFAPAIVSSMTMIEDGISKYLHWVDGNTGPQKELPMPDKNDTTALYEDKQRTTGNKIKAWSEIVAGSILMAPTGGLLGTGLYGRGESRLYDMGEFDITAKSSTKWSDAWDNMMAEQKKKQDELTKQIKGSADAAVTTIPETKEKQEHFKVYADKMTETGNMLGHSFSSLGVTANALDVAKNSLTEQKKQTILQQQFDAKLQDIGMQLGIIASNQIF